MIRKSIKIAICVVAGTLVMTSCSSTVTKMMVKLEPEKPSVLTHPSLQKFMAQNKGAAVVVRDPNAVQGGVSASGKTNELCGMIERALMKKGYNPRDRRLFESVAAKMSDVDYVALGEQTKTDLVLEVTNFSQEEFVIRNYQEYKDIYIYNPIPFTSDIYLKRNKITQKSLKEPRTIYGYSIEIKVVLLQDNLIGGTYRYFWTPCTLYGCDLIYEDVINRITRWRSTDYGYINKYILTLDKKIWDESLPQEERDMAFKILGNPDARGKSFVEVLRNTMEEQFQPISLNEFVSDVVIPSLFKDMGEDAEE
ncbi:MAG: hypothetical protein LBJ57_01080 [Prevotellaceae bacterium]|jgi:hypothetical protein|nr:hypothetical protein [Prevotellaceae bacterium]